jgi:cephalosporin-C deacetylase-like acetyl esterase
MGLDDFGLTPEQTLGHTGDTTPPPGFVQFWETWRARVGAVAPGFIEPTPDEREACDARGITHFVRSTDDIRLGARLTEPDARPVEGVVITLHGYHVNEADELRIGRGWSKRGCAVIDLRVRGYPGSRLDTGDLTSRPGGYIDRKSVV